MWQFSLRSLLLAMLAVCVLTWLTFVLEPEISGMILISIHFLVPALTISGIFYLPGAHRAFFIGVAPLAVVCILFGGVWILDDGFRNFFGSRGRSDLDDLLLVSLPLGAMFASGWIAVGVHAWGLRLKRAEAVRQEQATVVAAPATERRSLSPTSL